MDVSLYSSDERRSENQSTENEFKFMRNIKIESCEVIDVRNMDVQLQLMQGPLFGQVSVTGTPTSSSDFNPLSVPGEFFGDSLMLEQTSLIQPHVAPENQQEMVPNGNNVNGEQRNKQGKVKKSGVAKSLVVQIDKVAVTETPTGVNDSNNPLVPEEVYGDSLLREEISLTQPNAARENEQEIVLNGNGEQPSEQRKRKKSGVAKSLAVQIDNVSVTETPTGVNDSNNPLVSEEVYGDSLLREEISLAQPNAARENEQEIIPNGNDVNGEQRSKLRKRKKSGVAKSLGKVSVTETPTGINDSSSNPSVPGEVNHVSFSGEISFVQSNVAPENEQEMAPNENDNVNGKQLNSKRKRKESGIEKTSVQPVRRSARHKEKVPQEVAVTPMEETVTMSQNTPDIPSLIPSNILSEALMLAEVDKQGGNENISNTLELVTEDNPAVTVKNQKKSGIKSGLPLPANPIDMRLVSFREFRRGVLNPRKELSAGLYLTHSFTTIGTNVLKDKSNDEFLIQVQNPLDTEEVRDQMKRKWMENQNLVANAHAHGVDSLGRKAKALSPDGSSMKRNFLTLNADNIYEDLIAHQNNLEVTKEVIGKVFQQTQNTSSEKNDSEQRNDSSKAGIWQGYGKHGVVGAVQVDTEKYQRSKVFKCKQDIFVHEGQTYRPNPALIVLDRISDELVELVTAKRQKISWANPYYQILASYYDD